MRVSIVTQSSYCSLSPGTEESQYAKTDGKESASECVSCRMSVKRDVSVRFPVLSE